MPEKMMTPKEYQRHVLLMLTSIFPDKHFQITPDPLIIRYEEAEMGLENLYAVYRRDQLPPKDRDEHIRLHFSRIITNLKIEEVLDLLSWAGARGKILVQLMPAGYRHLVPLASYPLSPEVEIGIVVDLPNAYTYVREKDVERWNITWEQLYEEGLRNLDKASAGLAFQYADGPDRFLSLESKDSFDAARLLLPSIRKFVTEHLGEPCLAAIPNRDFLFFWPVSNSVRFNQLVREQVQRDFEMQPYALTPKVFVVTESKVVPEEMATKP